MAAFFGIDSRALIGVLVFWLAASGLMLGYSFVLIRESAKIMVHQKERINHLEFRVSRLEAGIKR